MLISFKTKSHADIAMFEKVALKMLSMMGHSETVPGAILAEDVQTALNQLRAAVAKGKDEFLEEESDSEELAVSLSHRAAPLIELLSTAATAGEDVMWEKTTNLGWFG